MLFVLHEGDRRAMKGAVRDFLTSKKSVGTAAKVENIRKSCEKASQVGRRERLNYMLRSPLSS